MALGTIFKNSATMAVGIFTKEFKPCTYKSLKDTSVYDPDTGEYTHEYDEYPLKIAFDAIQDGAPLPLKFKNEHMTALIPGDKLPVVPKRGDIIIDWNENELLIDTKYIEKDQYSALYTVYVSNINLKEHP